jgi:hypothetical protein
MCEAFQATKKRLQFNVTIERYCNIVLAVSYLLSKLLVNN